MGQTERRGRALQIAAALTGTVMVALAGVLAGGGLTGASLTQAGMPDLGGDVPAHRSGMLVSVPTRVPAAQPTRRAPAGSTPPHARVAATPASPDAGPTERVPARVRRSGEPTRRPSARPTAVAPAPDRSGPVTEADRSGFPAAQPPTGVTTPRPGRRTRTPAAPQPPQDRGDMRLRGHR
ncbi:hypothetical protein [Nonomuraea sp. NPDC003214]